VLAALIGAASHQRREKLRTIADKAPGGLSVSRGGYGGNPGTGSGQDRLPSFDLEGEEPIVVQEARFLLSPGGDEDLVFRMIAGGASDNDQLVEMQASLAQFGVEISLDELQIMAGEQGVKISADTAPEPAGPVQLSSNFDFETAQGTAEPIEGDLS